MTRVCICQICTCGRHRCPHHPGVSINRGEQPCLLSEYNNKYRKHPLERTLPIKPDNKPNTNLGPLEDATTQRVDYVKHPYEKPYVHEGDTYRKPEGSMDHLTNYTKEYPKKEGERAKPIKRDSGPRVPGKFEGNPTYKNDYRRWSAKREKPIIRDGAYRPNSEPFEGCPTYQKDYVKHPFAARGMMKPAETAVSSGAPMDDSTGYRDEYVRHPLAPRQLKEKAVYQPNAAKLDDLTTNRKDYTAKDGYRADSFKPTGNAYQSNAPFDDHTTQRVDYQKWQAEKPYVHEQEAYRKPEGAMYMDTTHHTDFTKKPLVKNAPIKPSSAKRVPGNFDDATNYKEDYRKWNTERTRPKPRQEYQPNDAQFEGMPTYQKDYVKHPFAARGMMKPAETAVSSGAPMDDSTGYRDEYVRHPLAPRQLKEKAVYQPNAAKLDDLTTNRKDYTAKDGYRADSFKPTGNAYQSNAPFDDHTTQRVDYQKWQAEKPYVHEQEAYRKPEGAMYMDTTHHTDFTKKPLVKNAPIKPSSAKRVPGNFDDATNYKEDYRKWNQERTRPKPRQEYQPNDAQFEGMPTYQKDYVKHPFAARGMMKPAETAVSSGAPMEDGTEYRSEYLKKVVSPCPAIAVETGTSRRFRFKEQDDRGHKWYDPDSQTSITSLNMNGQQQQRPPAIPVA